MKCSVGVTRLGLNNMGRGLADVCKHQQDAQMRLRSMGAYQEEVEILCLQGVEAGAGPWALQVGVAEGVARPCHQEEVGVGRPCHQEGEEVGVGLWLHLEAGVEAVILWRLLAGVGVEVGLCCLQGVGEAEVVLLCLCLQASRS